MAHRREKTISTCNRNRPPRKQADHFSNPQSCRRRSSSPIESSARQDPSSHCGECGPTQPHSGVWRQPMARTMGMTEVELRNLRLDTGNFRVTSGREQGTWAASRCLFHRGQRFMDSAVVTEPEEAWEFGVRSTMGKRNIDSAKVGITNRQGCGQSEVLC